LRGGLNGSIYGTYGEAYDSLGQITQGASAGTSWNGAGASYGGRGGHSNSGGLTNVPYGLLENPVYLGSGGGAAWTIVPGNHGGGRASITAGACIVDGIISANGGDGIRQSGRSSGSGSGGSILLSVGNFSGSGTLQAVGGNDPGSLSSISGSGGGGRIAIYYDNISFPDDNIYAYGGNTGNRASSGTIYLKDNAQTNGDLIIDNNTATGLYTPFRSSLNLFRNLTIRDYGNLNPISNDVNVITIEQPILLNNYGNLKLGSGVTLAVTNAVGFDINIDNGSVLTLDSASALNADAISINNGTLNSNINLTFPNAADFELTGSGTLNILNDVIFGLGVFDQTNIKSGTVNLTENSRLDISSNSVVIDSSVTLIKDGQFGTSNLINSITINSGGALTHSPRLLSGLVLDVAGTLDIQSGGMIDLNIKGLRGGLNGSIYGTYGE
ncbi:MAG: hypothetical protein GY799_23560, partial [Desulfobulbaceae bacterium]|nr:hypothetical protein [Desulfobulbaceae bacterium]